MTRKHFIAIADAVANIPDMETRKDIARRMATVCRDTNPQFDLRRFLIACNVPTDL
jgi:hypothetical protein